MAFAETPSIDPCDASDSTLGPAIDPSCRGGFDFTLLFEQCIFTILPCSLFLLAIPVRVWTLRHAETVARLDGKFVANLVKCIHFHLHFRLYQCRLKREVLTQPVD